MHIGLYVACILGSFFGLCVKWLYKPARRVRNFLLTTFISLVLLSQLESLYLIALRSPFSSMIAIILFDHYWFYFRPFYPNSDAAGNGMARGFRSFYVTVTSVILGVISFLLIQFFKVNGNPIGLYIVLAFAALISISIMLMNRESHLSGDAFDDHARWAKLRTEDYRKALFRESMLEGNDEWEGKELDAVPIELTHWDVYGSNNISVKTYGKLCFFLLEGKFTFSTETHSVSSYGLLRGCLGFAGDEGGDSPPVPSHVVMAWYDFSEGNTYKLDADLPDELNRYLDDEERFRWDYIEFQILPHGKVVMYHNWRNQIHNIMLDYPLQGELTKEYEQKVSDFLKEKKSNFITHERTGDEIGEVSGVPSLETINNYLKRFHYTILFRPENDRFKITKTICRFFNGEKILSGGEWEEKMDPARLKDVFLRFEDEKEKYSCFIYFNKEEILRVFDEAFGNRGDSLKGEFIIRVGTGESAFTFEIKAGGKCYPLHETEIRLYRNNKDDAGKLVFKSYNGNHKNLM
ncbi:MAG: hypothetical protein IKD90_05495 [Clostridiales bacterium]|nr:hypothetical protein [Clostridiales bacterium]